MLGEAQLDTNRSISLFSFFSVSIKDAIEAKRPMTRSLLEQKIESAQKELDDAVERKAFHECESLQEKLERLIAMRPDLPTITELRQAVQVIEADVELAVRNRDFAVAASKQSGLEKARRQLTDALAADGTNGGAADQTGNQQSSFGFESRAQLEQEISELSIQIDAAIASRDFVKASSLQHVMEEREKLRPLFPSMDELQSQLDAAKKNLSDAVLKKDFVAAGKLNETIADIEKKIEDEKSRKAEPGALADVSFVTIEGEKLVFDSRADLEKEISATSAKVAKCVASKDFKKADSIQSDVDRLSKLRKLLPSVAELKDQLLDRKKELKAAIHKKQFARADELNLAIEALESKLAKEKSAAPVLSAKTSQDTMGNEVISVKTSPMIPAVARSDVSTSHHSAVSAPIRAGPPMEVRLDGSRSAIDFDDDMSDVPSVHSGTSAREKSKQVSTQSDSNLLSAVTETAEERPVSKLRPSKPIVAASEDSVLRTVKLLASKRGTASLIMSPDGSLTGIMSDKDVTCRVVAKYLNPETTSVAEVMSPNPIFVSMNDAATDALTTMVEHRYRHLPVIDSRGSVAGTLDITKCLNTIIKKLEKTQDMSSKAAVDVVNQVVSQQGSDDAQTAALQVLLGNLMSQAIGEKTVPTLRSLLHTKPRTVVSPTTTIREAGIVMAENRSAALVVKDDMLVGIFGFKDMMTRAVSKELDLDTTLVELVMTPEPDTVSPETSVLEALHVMLDNKFLTLPVCDQDEVVGLVDVLDLIYG